MSSRPANANGTARRRIRALVLHEEDDCYLCGQPVDKSLGFIPGQHGPRCSAPGCTGCRPHPMRPEVDEVVPRSRGGSPIDRDNVRLTHRRCNQAKSDADVTVAIARLNPERPTGLVVTTRLDW